MSCSSSHQAAAAYSNKREERCANCATSSIVAIPAVPSLVALSLAQRAHCNPVFRRAPVSKSVRAAVLLVANFLLPHSPQEAWVVLLLSIFLLPLLLEDIPLLSLQVLSLCPSRLDDNSVSVTRRLLSPFHSFCSAFPWYSCCLPFVEQRPSIESLVIAHSTASLTAIHSLPTLATRSIPAFRTLFRRAPSLPIFRSLPPIRKTI